ncbi:GH1 family beta-glucosidase [soil metagenome]
MIVTTINFARDFQFGVATSAFQIEGAWDQDGKGPSIWDTFSQTPGKVHNDVPGNVAVDHYHRFPDDVRIMKDLGIDSYRFSLSWARLMPEGTGAVNQKGVDFYNRLLDELAEADIAPNVTLYHWDLPQALQDRGGWPNRDVADWFADYAALAFDRFGDRVDRWATLNEPIALWVGYGMGVFAPGIADPRAGKQAMHNAMLAHGRAVQQFRAAGSPGEIGLVLDIWQRHPATESEADRVIALRDEDDSFRFFLDAILAGGYSDRLLARLEEEGTLPDIRPGDFETTAAPIDFLGLNVYSRVVVSAENYNPQWWVAGDTHPGGNFLDNGMEFYPKSVYDAIFMAKNEYGFGRPIYITENGVADAHTELVDGVIDDAERVRYVAGFLEWIAKAIEDGADVRGYYLWSLMDNFEWAAGFSQRFGLVHVDTETLERTPKASALWYRDVIARRSLDVG